MKLDNLQEQFLSLLLNVKETDVNPEALVHPIGKQNADNSISIYRNNMQASLQDVVSDTYPVGLRLTGEPFFRAMARYYIASNPSNHKSLNDYGEDFADFVLTFAPAKDLPYLSDLLRLEWFIHKAWIGPDLLKLDLNALAEIEADNHDKLVFKLSGNANLLCSAFPVDKIWELNHNLEQEVEENIDLDDTKEMVYLFIWRKGYELRIDRLKPDEFDALKFLNKSLPFGDICETLLTLESKPNIIDLLPRFIQQGYIEHFSLN